MADRKAQGKIRDATFDFFDAMIGLMKMILSSQKGETPITAIDLAGGHHIDVDLSVSNDVLAAL